MLPITSDDKKIQRQRQSDAEGTEKGKKLEQMETIEKSESYPDCRILCLNSASYFLVHEVLQIAKSKLPLLAHLEAPILSMHGHMHFTFHILNLLYSLLSLVDLVRYSFHNYVLLCSPTW